MKKFLLSALALFFVFATVHAQTSDATTPGKTTQTSTQQTKTKTAAVQPKHKHSGSALHRKAGTNTKKTNATYGTTAPQKPVATTTTTPAAATRQTTKSTAAGAKGAHYAVNSSGKKTFVKSPHSR